MTLRPSTGPRPLIAAALVLAAFAVICLALPARDGLGRPLPLAMLLGGAFGWVLQRTRFCFFCVTRDWIDDRDPRGLIAIVIALAIGLIGYAAILGAWLPNPLGGRLPPDAHVGPVSMTLALGAFVFGIGMAASGSCVSAHFYRLGEGSGGSVVALIGAAAGFALGFLSWNTLYLRDIQAAPVVWLPGHLGYAWALLLQLAVLGLVAVWLLRGGWPAAVPAASPGAAFWHRRWPAPVGGILVGLIATIAYLRVGPLGVTSELGSLSRTAAAGFGWLPTQLYGLDGLAGCATVIKETVLSRNGVFVLGLVLAAFASALIAGDWKPSLPPARDLPRLALGGVMLGWGAMVSLGCTVGVLLSGIMAGAGSGWVFAVFCYAGVWLGWKVRRRFA